MSRLLIISHDIIGERMAGVGIRYWEIACSMSAEQEVLLAAPRGSDLPKHSASRFQGAFHVYDPHQSDTLAEVIQWCDVLFAYPDTIWRCRNLIGTGNPAVVVDGYDITLLEQLEAHLTANQSPEPLEWLKQYLAINQYVIERGDLFLVSTERQRDWWLGALASLGRVNHLTYQHDRSLRNLVGLLQYGIPDVPPRHTRNVLRGVVNGIGAEDKIVLWGGGVWQWLDPFTLIHAAARLAESHPQIKFVFPGLKHPHSHTVPPMPIQEAVTKLADELKLTGRNVFFGEWVSYEDWPNYLLESDVGVSLHKDHLEARLSARTRVLSYVWAGIPAVLTRGDELSEQVAEAGGGILVQEGDISGVADAILSALSKDTRQFNFKLEGLRSQFRWSSVTSSLKQFCEAPHRAPDARLISSIKSLLSPDSEPIAPSDPPQETSVPAIQVPAPTSWLGRLLAPFLNSIVIWYLRSLVEQQNVINAKLWAQSQHLLTSLQSAQQGTKQLQAELQHSRQQLLAALQHNQQKIEQLTGQMMDIEQLQTETIATLLKAVKAQER